MPLPALTGHPETRQRLAKALRAGRLPAGPAVHGFDGGGQTTARPLARAADHVRARRRGAVWLLPSLPPGHRAEPRRRPLVRPDHAAQGRGSGQAGGGSRRGAGRGDGRAPETAALQPARRDGQPSYRQRAAAAPAGGADGGGGWTPGLHHRRGRSAGASGVESRGGERDAEAAGGAAPGDGHPPDDGRCPAGAADHPVARGADPAPPIVR